MKSLCQRCGLIEENNYSYKPCPRCGAPMYVESINLSPSGSIK